MGWQDAPVVDGGKKAAWESAPVVGKPDAVQTALDRSGTAGVLDAGLALATGAVAAPIAGLKGLVTAASDGGEKGAEAVRNTQDRLTYEPRTKLGKGLVKAISYPFQKLGEVADAAGEKTAEATGSPLAGATTNALLQSVPIVLGKTGPIGESAEALATRRLAKAQNAGTDTALTNAKGSGYVVPPTQANPSLLNQIVEGVAGKIKTAQKASEQNQPVTNNLVRKALGIAEDQPLNAEALNQVRKTAGEAYERVRGAGRVVADPLYGEALDKIAAPFESASKDFPDAARKDILDTVKAHRREAFDAGSAVDQISGLREKADAAYAAKDKKAGKAYKDIANAMEEQLGRHLEESGASPEALKDFRTARETIAKSYTVQKHLQENGNVDARGLAAELKRKPLTEELKTAAQFGKNFPKAAQLPEKIGGVPMSPWEHYAAGGTVIGGLLTGHPTVALAGLAPYARPAVQNALLSKWYQERFANPREYGPSQFSRLRDLALESQTPGLATLEMAEGQQRK